MQKNSLSGKKIILGVTGCIAAYKACLLVREFIKNGAEVKVVMTPSALQFITPLTLSSLSGNQVIVNTFPADQKNGTGVSTWHIDYALWADLMIIAPCTVNTAAKIAHGFADNALTTLCSAVRSPLMIVPAADVDMYQNPITQANFKALSSAGYYLLSAEEGELASGLTGKGRLPEISKIIEAAQTVLSGVKKDLEGKKILITAGPTFEDIDPVRYIGNRSSGKMGYNLAKAAYLRGADVTLISGPSNEAAYPEIKMVKVRSAADMKKAVDEELKNNEILIMSAAVADYKPDKAALRKIKKEEGIAEIKLSLTADILSSINKEGKVIAGFALETDNEEINAVKKLNGKGLDMIVLNSLNEQGSGFEHDTNKITIISKGGRKKEFPLQMKFEAAHVILSEIINIKAE